MLLTPLRFMNLIANDYLVLDANVDCTLHMKIVSIKKSISPDCWLHGKLKTVMRFVLAELDTDSASTAKNYGTTSFF